MLIVNEPLHTPSAFLTYNTVYDVFKSSSAEDAADKEKPDDAIPELSYLRMELVRIRAGMSDFIVRVSTPKSANQVKSNTLITLRANKQHGSLKGVRDMAQTISKEMHLREDSTHKWDTTDLTHTTKLLFPYLKFFSSNLAVESMQFTTEALL